MILIKLDYFTLLSPEPISINGVFNIKSPTLREISKIGNGLQSFYVYRTYVNSLLMDKDSYYETINNNGEEYFYNYTDNDKNTILNIKAQYDNMSVEDKNKIHFFDLLKYDINLLNIITEALNFFIIENVSFSTDNCVFLISNEENKLLGYLDNNSYKLITDIIFQRINIKKEDSEYDGAKVKNKLASKLLEKMKKANKIKKQKEDKKMEMPNIISSLAAHGEGLNIINIWDLTVYQLYDQFTRQRLGDSFKLSSANVAAWGDSEGKFDDTIWFSYLQDD